MHGTRERCQRRGHAEDRHANHRMGMTFAPRCLALAVVLALGTRRIEAAVDPLLGEVIMFAGNFAPRGWALCDGQLLPISSNSALFSIIGTIYGGDGRTTFALPDLRSRSPMHAGRGPGLSHRDLGHRNGQEYVTLTTSEIPSHRHVVNAFNVSGTSPFPESGSTFGSTSCCGKHYSKSTANGQQMHYSTLGNTGGGQSHNNMAPFLAVNFIIALQGTFPSRN